MCVRVCVTTVLVQLKLNAAFVVTLYPCACNTTMLVEWTVVDLCLLHFAVRSRVLMSVREEADDPGDHYGPATPFSYREMLVSFFHGSGGLLSNNPKQEVAERSHYEALEPEMPQVHITDAQSVRDANLHNETGDRKLPAATSGSPRPDMTADVPAPIDHTTL